MESNIILDFTLAAPSILCLMWFETIVQSIGKSGKLSGDFLICTDYFSLSPIEYLPARRMWTRHLNMRFLILNTKSKLVDHGRASWGIDLCVKRASILMLSPFICRITLSFQQFQFHVAMSTMTNTKTFKRRSAKPCPVATNSGRFLTHLICVFQLN